MATDVKGLKEMSRVLKKLPERVARKVVNASLREGAKVVQDAAQSSAISQFQGEGTVAESVAVGKGRSRKFGQLLWRVGIAGGGKMPAELKAGTYRASKTPLRRRGAEKRTGVVGFGNSDGQAYYWRFLEVGTSKMAARPFMRPAGQGTVAIQVAVIRKILKRGVLREAKKLQRGA